MTVKTGLHAVAEKTRPATPILIVRMSHNTPETSGVLPDGSFDKVSGAPSPNAVKHFFTFPRSGRVAR
jgi:hypothetical protein